MRFGRHRKCLSKDNEAANAASSIKLIQLISKVQIMGAMGTLDIVIKNISDALKAIRSEIHAVNINATPLDIMSLEQRKANLDQAIEYCYTLIKEAQVEALLGQLNSLIELIQIFNQYVVDLDKENVGSLNKLHIAYYELHSAARDLEKFFNEKPQVGTPGIQVIPPEESKIREIREKISELEENVSSKESLIKGQFLTLNSALGKISEKADKGLDDLEKLFDEANNFIESQKNTITSLLGIASENVIGGSYDKYAKSEEALALSLRKLALSLRDCK